MLAIQKYNLKSASVNITLCMDTGATTYNVQFEAPMLMTLGLPACDADPTDNACRACAKVSCCDQYEACAADDTCLCLVNCEAAGNPESVCTTAAICGPLDATSSTTSACLVTSCNAQCVSMGSMAAGMCPGGTGTGGGPATCTPGSFGAGESCFSDGDCASCVCNNDFCN